MNQNKSSNTQDWLDQELYRLWTKAATGGYVDSEHEYVQKWIKQSSDIINAHITRMIDEAKCGLPNRETAVSLIRAHRSAAFRYSTAVSGGDYTTAEATAAEHELHYIERSLTTLLLGGDRDYQLHSKLEGGKND